MRALISVWEKRGLAEFAIGLQELGVTIFSTGNTARSLMMAGVAAQSVSKLTDFPEILDGRVKTLHPAIHGGILARRDLPAHMQELADHQIAPIDLVVVNLYPFVETVAQPGVTLDEALEKIDIGGVTLLRAAAKNHQHVLPVVDPADYAEVLSALREEHVPPALRRRLAAKAFAHTAAYDAAIAAYLSDERFPRRCRWLFTKRRIYAMARTRTRPPRSMAISHSFSSSCTAKNCPISTSSISPPSRSCSRSLPPRTVRRWRSSSTPTHVAWALLRRR